MEEDDPVVLEIPLFISQALKDNLYLYQYQTKSSRRNWNSAKVINACIKPKNQVVKLEVGLDTYSDKYSVSKGEQFALNTDGQLDPSKHTKNKDRDKAPYFRSGMMDKVVYESSPACVDTESFAVALLKDKELHCTPVKGIVQLRPMHSYYDKMNSKKKDVDKDNSDEEEEIEAQQVTVKFAMKESEVAKKSREQSYEYISKKNLEEPWYDALYKHDDTDHADLERLKLICAQMGPGASLKRGGERYVRSLVPSSSASSPSLSVIECCSQLLISGKLVAAHELRRLAGAGRERGDALLLRGLWAPAAERVLCGASARAARLRAARDHVLYLFTKSSCIDRRKVAATVLLPPNDVLNILSSVAKYNPQKKGWELLIPPDVEFEAKHPQLVQRHNLYWEARNRQFTETMIGDSIPKRQRKKSQRDSIGSDTMMSPKARCNSASEEEGGDGKRRGKGKTL